MTTQYSTMQKLSLAGMVIGSLMCLVGACAPYWIISDPQGFGEFDLVGKVVKGSIGLFVYCAELLGKSGCEAFDMDNDSAASGAYCVAVFSRNTESFTGSILGFQVSSYGWAYYLFIAGVATLGLVAFTACFSAPNSPLRGLVLTQSPAPQMIVSSSTSTAAHPYMHLQEQGGPVMMGPSVSNSATVVTTNGY